MRFNSSNLSGCLIDDADTNATALETFLMSVSDHCPHLDMLDLSNNNNLGVPGASALAVAISHHYDGLTDTLGCYGLKSLWLTSINLNNTNLGDEGLRAFVEELESLYHFTNLYLQNNGIHASGLVCLAKMTQLDPCYHYYVDCSGECDLYLDYIMENCGDLDLNDNPIGIEGVVTTGEVLCNCDQRNVNLRRCHLTTVMENINNSDTIKHVGRQLGQMLESTCIIQSLLLDGNSFTGERIYILAGFVRLCASLLVLSCCDCDITSDDLIQLLEILAKSKVSYPDLCHELSTWDP